VYSSQLVHKHVVLVVSVDLMNTCHTPISDVAPRCLGSYMHVTWLHWSSADELSLCWSDATCDITVRLNLHVTSQHWSSATCNITLLK